MKIAIASDLHVDVGSQPSIEWPEADVLVIAGDTANNIGSLLKIAGQVAEKYKNVVIVDGNHEHYSNRKQHRTIDMTIENIILQLPDNVHFLGTKAPAKDVVVIDGYAFIGCNGWYGDNASFDGAFWKEYMNDFNQIFTMNGEGPATLAMEHGDHILGSVGAALVDGLIPVVVTHTSPTILQTTNKPWDPSWNRANQFYYNPFMQETLDKFGPQIPLWIHGHVHTRKATEINGCYIMCNPRGYPSENAGWTPIVMDI